MKRLAASMMAFLGMLGPAFADEPPVAWTDELPVAWADAPPAFTAGPVAAALPPIDFDLSALSAAPAPVVAAPQPFRGIERREGHQCPTCYRTVLAKAGRGPVSGSHLHRCPFDGTTWWHLDQ